MTTPLPDDRSCAARALVLLHDSQMRGFLEVWQQAKATNTCLPNTPNAHYGSLKHLPWHVLNSSGLYMVRMCGHLDLPDPRLDSPPAVEDVAARAKAYLDRLLGW